jgi:hypothetical protein
VLPLKSLAGITKFKAERVTTCLCHQGIGISAAIELLIDRKENEAQSSFQRQLGNS